MNDFTFLFRTIHYTKYIYALVSLNNTVDEYQVGATIGYSPVAFTLSFNKVTSEFKSGSDYSFVNGAVTFIF